jgi:phage antirepressor YoqD-like protein
MDENAIEVRVQQEYEKYLSNPVNLIKACMALIEKSEKQIAELKPKAEIWDQVMGSERLEEMSAVVKILNFRDMGRNRLFEYLRDRNILRYNNEPYQQYVDSGYFKVIEQTAKVDSYTIINNKTMVTQKGLEYIGKLLKGDGYVENAR